MEIIRHDSPCMFGKLNAGDLFLMEGAVMLKLCPIDLGNTEKNAINLVSGYPYYVPHGQLIQPVDGRLEIRNKGGFDDE